MKYILSFIVLILLFANMSLAEESETVKFYADLINLSKQGKIKSFGKYEFSNHTFIIFEKNKNGTYDLIILNLPQEAKDKFQSDQSLTKKYGFPVARLNNVPEKNMPEIQYSFSFLCSHKNPKFGEFLFGFAMATSQYEKYIKLLKDPKTSKKKLIEIMLELHDNSGDCKMKKAQIKQNPSSFKAEFLNIAQELHHQLNNMKKCIVNPQEEFQILQVLANRDIIFVANTVNKISFSEEIKKKVSKEELAKTFLFHVPIHELFHFYQLMNFNQKADSGDTSISRNKIKKEYIKISELRDLLDQQYTLLLEAFRNRKNEKKVFELLSLYFAARKYMQKKYSKELIETLDNLETGEGTAEYATYMALQSAPRTKKDHSSDKIYQLIKNRAEDAYVTGPILCFLLDDHATIDWQAQVEQAKNYSGKNSLANMLYEGIKDKIKISDFSTYEFELPEGIKRLEFFPQKEQE